MARANDKPPVERYHDRVAGIYDTIYEGKGYWEVVFEITWRHLKKFLPRDQSCRCLDVGCGTGRWGLKLLKSGYPTDFLDISHKMLDKVGKKLTRLSPPPSPMPELFQASIEDLRGLDIPAERYGLIIGQGDPLSCCARPERALKEMTRLLAPGGIMVMAVDNRYAGIRHYLKDADISGLKKFLQDGRTTWVTDNPDEQYPLVMFTPAGIRQMCARRNLEVLSLIGKTALPLRRFQNLLQDREARTELLRIEESLHATEAVLGNAAHLEFIARKAE